MTSESDDVQAGEVTAEQADESLRKLFDAGRRTRKDAFSTTWLLDVQLHIATLRAKLTEAERRIASLCADLLARADERDAANARADEAERLLGDIVRENDTTPDGCVAWGMARAVDAARSHLQSLKAKEPTDG